MNSYESIDIVCSKISNHMVLEMNIESLCDDMSNINIKYNEFNELKEAINIVQTVDYCSDKARYIVEKTQERYIRYLKHVKVWKHDCESCHYLRDKIIKFINIPIVNFESIYIKIDLMKYIDLDIMKII